MKRKLLGMMAVVIMLIASGCLSVSSNGHWFEDLSQDPDELRFLAGVGGPEGFLYESSTRQQEIISELIAYGGNAIYMHTVRSHEGDGGPTENPFVNNDPAQGVDQSVLDSWHTIFEQMQDNEIAVWLTLYDDHSRPFGPGCTETELQQDEKDYVEAVMTTFADLGNIIYITGEEHTNGACGEPEYGGTNADDIRLHENLAAEMRSHNGFAPIGVHHMNGETNQYLGNSDINVFAQQSCLLPNNIRDDISGTDAKVTEMHAQSTGHFGEDVYVMAECHPWHRSLMNDPAANRTAIRQSMWAVVMAGGHVMLYDAYESDDPTPEVLGDLARISDFMESINYRDFVPDDASAYGYTRWVMSSSSTNDTHLLYGNRSPSSLGVKNLAGGTYNLTWYDPATGTTVNKLTNRTAGDLHFTVPTEILGATEVVLYLRLN